VTPTGHETDAAVAVGEGRSVGRGVGGCETVALGDGEALGGVAVDVPPGSPGVAVGDIC
jgi:hypothetical protein